MFLIAWLAEGAVGEFCRLAGMGETGGSGGGPRPEASTCHPPLSQFGIEKLREWMAGHLLGPLVAAIDSAHTAVMEAATPLGGTGVQLSPLDQAIQTTSREAGASRAASAQQCSIVLRPARLLEAVDSARSSRS